MDNLNEKISQILEGQNLDQKQIEEIMGELSSINFGDIDPTRPREETLKLIDNDLKAQLDSKTDWRERARIAARIISNGLE